MWVTSNCAGYLVSCRVSLFVRGTLNRAGYLRLYGIPQSVWGTSKALIMLGTLDCAGVIPFVDTRCFTTSPLFLPNTCFVYCTVVFVHNWEKQVFDYLP